jgi:hypothetical protein
VAVRTLEWPGGRVIPGCLRAFGTRRHNWGSCSPSSRASLLERNTVIRRYRKPRRGLALSRETRQNADLSLDNMYVVSVLAQAELAFNLRRQEPSIWLDSGCRIRHFRPCRSGSYVPADSLRSFALAGFCRASPAGAKGAIRAVALSAPTSCGSRVAQRICRPVPPAVGRTP